VDVYSFAHTLLIHSSQVDVYSFALLLYEIVCHTSAFEAAQFDAMAIALAVAHQSYRPKLPSAGLSLDPGQRVTPSVEALLIKCWDEDPTKVTYTLLIHSSHTLLSYTVLSYTPLIHSSHTHSSHTLLSYTPLIHSSYTLLSYTLLSYTLLSYAASRLSCRV
jgi:hypothetical protein